MSYLDRFAKKSKAKDTRSRQAINVDKWDRFTADQIRREVRDYVVAENDLSKKVETGIEAMNDALFALYKARPELLDKKDVRPSFAVNHAVISEMMELKDYEKNRPVSVGDPIGTGLAAAAMEPDLEVLFEKLSKAQDMANNLESMLQQSEELQQSADELMDEAKNADSDDAQNYQDQVDKINEALEALKQQIEQSENDLNDELNDKQGVIQQYVQSAMDNVSDQNDALAQVESWGLQPGGVRRMNPEARIELSRKLKSDKFKKMADIFGKMQSMAVTEQLHRVDYAMEEIYDLEQGADLNRVVPIEMLALSDDILIYEWLHRFTERSLVQYSLRGEDTVAKGGILILEDGSSSMAGSRETWAKAIGLALLKVAMMQKRPFNAINFAGPGEYVRWDFDTSGDVVKAVKTYRGRSERLDGLQAVLDYAETALHGGTNFETPFSVALDILQEQNNKDGAVNGDIVFLTDGECGVSPNFISDFKMEQHRLGFEVFGIAVQTNPKSEPMYTLCDQQVIDLKQLTDVNDMRPLFSRI